MGEDEFGVVFPAAGVPGALAVVCKVRNASRFRALQTADAPAVYRVEAVVGSHVPLTGQLDDLVRSMPTNSLSVADPPLPIYVHHGGHDAVYLDLQSTTGGPLSGIGLDVDADSPFAAFAGARSAANELLDVLMRSLWMSLVLVRLDLFVSGESEPVATAAVLLHYGVGALQELSSFFRQHLNGRVSRGSVLPMVAQRDRYRVVARMSPTPREDGAA